ncbi:MAG: metallophosphoesterase [Eubacterium sp.]|nr:metallophosphoesterase [Eubacterium sp.]
MKITFIADTHHYSKTLGTSGKAYELRSGSDQKCLAETGEIIDAAFHQIAESDTDAVFILGDVTNDGEMASHLEFREKLYHLKKSKPVYIITATHDWCCDENPRRFEGDKTFHDVEVMKSADLPEFYKDFGPDVAIDTFITKIGTICYTVQLGDNVRILCLNDDKNENDHAGYTPDCWKWIEKQIKKAKEDNCILIGMQHHLLMPHVSSLITGGSVCVENREKVASRFADVGFKYMFAGHSHILATYSFTSKNGNTITEVNVGSLCGYPAPIVQVEINENGTLTYCVEHLKTFILNGKETEALPFLADHASALINRMFACRTKEDFEERLSAFNLNGKKFSKYWSLIKPVISKLDNMKTYEAYKLLKVLGFAKGVEKDAAKEFKDKPLKEFINEVWLSVLDGAMNPKDKNSAYYRLVLSVASVPSKIKKDSKNAKKLIEAADYALTGGDINNQSATI